MAPVRVVRVFRGLTEKGRRATPEISQTRQCLVWTPSGIRPEGTTEMQAFPPSLQDGHWISTEPDTSYLANFHRRFATAAKPAPKEYSIGNNRCTSMLGVEC